MTIIEEHDDHDHSAVHVDPKPAAASRRDSRDAKSKASVMLEQAQRASDAVAKFHAAADRIDAARAETDAATTERAEALRVMRDNGLSIVQMQDLTGLSNSRIQSILRGN